MKWKSSERGKILADRLGTDIVKQLVSQAIEARTKSYVPYSNFAVGAALLLKSGQIIQGCNIESCSYTPTNCAERSAVFSAISSTGSREFDAVAIVGANRDKSLLESDYCAPCGVCRQVLAEFADPESFLIILAKSTDDFLLYSLEELLPLGFYPSSL